MTITSYGYPGTFTAPPTRWAAMQQGLGVRYWVRNAASLLATPVQPGTREVSLSAGAFGGHGVVDSTDGELIQLPTVTAGTRYFMLVARRTWGTTNKTTIAVIDAGTSLATLPAREDEPGVLDDQPLWLIPLTAGDTVPGTPIDLRLLGTDRGVFQANSDLVRQYANTEGIEIVIGTMRWRRGSGANASATWYGQGMSPSDKRALVVSLGSTLVAQGNNGWTANVPTVAVQKAVRDGNRVDLWLQARKASGARLTPTSPGNFPDTEVLRIREAFAPNTETPFAFLYRGGTGTTNSAVVGGTGRLTPAGEVVLVGSAGDYGVNVEATLWTFKAHISFLQES